MTLPHNLNVRRNVIYRGDNPLATFSCTEVALTMQARLDGLIDGYMGAKPTTADLKTEQRIRELLGLTLP